MANYIHIPTRQPSPAEQTLLTQALSYWKAGNITAANRIWFDLAPKGIPAAQNNVGLAYKNGEGVKQDMNLAFYWMKLSAEGGYEKAMYNLGRMYSSIGDGANSLYWHEKAAGRGNLRSAWELAKIYTSQKKYALALPWLLQAAGNDNSAALVYLGAYYLNGWGVEKNANSAFSLYLAAAEKEEKEAFYPLALLYQYGAGTKKDLQKAWYWAAKSLAADIEVQKSYAIMEEYVKLRNGAGYHTGEAAANRTNARQTAEKLEKARRQAERERQYQLEKERRYKDILSQKSDSLIIDQLMDLWNSYDFEAGAVLSEYLVNSLRYTPGGSSNSVMKTAEREKWAYEFAQAAAETGVSAGMRLLAEYYYHGIYVKRDLKEALKWANAAVKAGDENIGFLWPLIRGEYDFERQAYPALAERDYKKTVKFMYNAANLRHPSAMFHMGRMLGEGLGTPVDPKNATCFHRQLMRYDRVVFGSYKQANEGSEEPIVWRIIGKEKGRALLLSENILECCKYHTIEPGYDAFLGRRKEGESFASYSDQARRIQQAKSKGVTWEQSELRQWLNSDFLNSAFNAEERNTILQTTLSTPENPGYSTNPGITTRDKVFVLSAQEVLQYLNTDSYGKKMISNESWGKYYLASGWHVTTQATPYAGRNLPGTPLGALGHHSWWLRTPGKMQHMASIALSNGWSHRLSLDGVESGNPNMGVRPAVWVRLWN